MRINNGSILIVLSCFMITYLTSCGKRNDDEKPIGEIIEKTVEKLVGSPLIEFEFNYELTGFLKDSDKAYKGKVKIQPQRNPDAYGFDNMVVIAKDSSESDKFELSKIGDDIYYYEHTENLMLHSTLFRLGSPLYSTKVKFTMLLYQYLPVLRDYKQYNPVYGKKEKVGGKEIQEIVFDINEYDFHVRFWIDVNNFEVYKIVSSQSKDNQSGKVIYYIRNFKESAKNQEVSSFFISKQKEIVIKEFSAGGPIIGETAPRWTLTSLDSSKTISLNELKGNIVVIDFWATWCKPCLESMPGINDLYLEFKNKGVKFIGITYNDNGNPLEYVKREGFTYKFLAGNENVYKQYGLNDIGIPTLFILDKKGKMVDFESGYNGEATINRLREKINLLLGS